VIAALYLEAAQQMCEHDMTHYGNFDNERTHTHRDVKLVSAVLNSVKSGLLAR